MLMATVSPGLATAPDAPRRSKPRARVWRFDGTARLVPSRSKTEEEKDAGVMRLTLASGLASGLRVWMPAAFTTMFVLAVLRVVGSFELQATPAFALIVARDPAA